MHRSRFGMLRPGSSTASSIDLAMRLLQFSAIAVFMCAAADTAVATAWRFELESAAFRFGDLGGTACQVVNCNDASGGKAVEGLDLPGEYAETDVTFLTQTCFIDSIRCSALTGVHWQFLVEFYPAGAGSRSAWDEHEAVSGRGFS
jgi:hypothetical protein